jgi:hypothetical protein
MDVLCCKKCNVARSRALRCHISRLSLEVSALSNYSKSSPLLHAKGDGSGSISKRGSLEEEEEEGKSLDGIWKTQSGNRHSIGTSRH